MSTSAAMTRFAHPRLAYKEFRQLLPLFAILPLLAIFSWVLLGLLPFLFNSPGPNSLDIIFQVPAIFYAVGVGGLLITEEKERRTFGWLQLLPIPTGEILRGKLWVSLFGLGAVWMVGLAAAFILQAIVPVSFDVFEWLSAFALSLFVLLSSIAISWYVHDFIKSVVLLLIIAGLPSLLGLLLSNYFSNTASWFDPQSQPDRVQSVWVIATQLACCLPVAYWAWQGGLQYLSAAQPRLQTTGSRWQLQPPIVDTTRWRSSSVSVAVTWQQFRQNRVLWLCLGGLYLVAAGLILNVLAVPHTTIGTRGTFGYMLAALATGWLGMSTFHGDYQRNRYQFLVQRGVSPGTIWLNRQQIPLLILATGCVAVVGCLLGSSQLQISGVVVLLPIMAHIVISLCTVYAVGQWVGQSIKSAVLAACLLPFCSLLIMFYYWFGVLLLGAPWWLMLGMTILIIGFTRYLAGIQFCGTTSNRLLLWQLSLGLLVLLIPWGPFFWLKWSLPPLNPVVQLQMQPVIATLPKLQTHQPTYNVQIFNSYGVQLSEDAADIYVGLESILSFSQIQDNIDRSLALFETKQGQFRGLVEQRQATYAFCNLLVARIESAPDPAAQKLYNGILAVLARHVKQLRSSPWDYQYNHCDELEIWLLSQLLNDDRLPLIEDDVYHQVTTVLQDHEGRRLSRRQALLYQTRDQQYWQQGPTWNSAWYQFKSFYHGMLDSNYRFGQNNLIEQSQRRHEAQRITEQLWLLSDNQDAGTNERLNELATASYFGTFAFGNYQRVDDARMMPQVSFRYQPLGTQWSAGWEKQALSLLTRPSNQALRQTQ